MRSALGLHSVLFVIVLVCLATPTKLVADYYDDFADGQYCQDPNDPDLFDPNLWDIDNPHWSLYPLVGRNSIVDASDGWLRLYIELDFLSGAFIGAGPDDGGRDPNTSPTCFDDSAPHYIVGKVKVFDPITAEVAFLIHGDPIYWTAYYASLDCDENALRAVWQEGLDRIRLGRVDLPDLDETNGFWMATQIDGDGDPNHTRFKMTAWNGEKFDWNGVWHRDRNILGWWDPNTCGYWAAGGCGVAAIQMNGALAVDAKFDQIECRWGTFSDAGRTLTLTVKNPENGTVTIDPDLLVDPNNLSTDPNVPTDPNEPRIYTDGTEIALVANPDPNGKGFNKWEVTDPLDANNNFSDTNLVLTLTMDRDWEVTAKFKCGSAALMPMIGLTLVALGVAALVRRLSADRWA